jgi:preprotein translocase subunit SecD
MFEEITGRNVGKPIAIILDGYPISIATVSQKISGGQAEISGKFTVPEAKLLVQRLNTGALPVPINLIGQQTVEASLGQQSIDNSFKAGIIGFLLVALFMILYYRLPGLISVFCLGIYVMAVLSIFKVMPIWMTIIFLAALFALFVSVFRELKIFDGILSVGLFVLVFIFLAYYAHASVTLTLAGITGFILSIGMAVDANILIFERMKEELRAGKPLDIAIDEGFKRAWPSIRDGNTTTILVCFVLMSFGTGLVKGFGATLFLGVAISMLSSIVITSSVMRVFVGKLLAKHPWWLGVKKINN